jgi:hypothetical protein
MSDKKITEENSTEDNIKVGSYVIEKQAVGVVVGQATDGQWIVEWPGVDFAPYSSEDLVSLYISLDPKDK